MEGSAKMPEIIRIPLRMDCNGIDLAHPVDRQPPGSFPFIENCRVVQEGRIEARPGYTVYDTPSTGPDLLHSIRRLNDPDLSLNAAGYTDIVGNGSLLQAGAVGALTTIASGFSGDPLSLIPFRPEQSPESWMYVYDSARSAKVRPDGVVRSIGVAPPTSSPSIEYGIPGVAVINEGQSSAGFSVSGAATAVGTFDRTNGDTGTITTVIYNSGTTGWCCIQPAVTQPFWMGERMRIILNSGGGNAETVVVREIHKAIPATTIAGIRFDSGTTGACSIVLTGNPVGLTRNSLIQIVGGGGTETVRVTEVILSPDGTVYSLRCVTANTHAAGATVSGILSWYVYTTLTHAAAETYSAVAVSVSQSAAGEGIAKLTSAVAASTANNRPISMADDYLHISMFFQDPQNIVNLKLLVSLDSTPNFSFTNPGNSWIWTISQSQLDNQGSSGNSWGEVVIPLSSGVRSGNDLTRTLANITGIALQLTTTGACAWGYDWWYLFGTFGPVIQPNSPTGYVYQSRFRDSSTGAASVPGPQNRYELFPLREQVVVTPATTATSGIDEIDIYRQGGTISSPLYVGSVTNNNSIPNSFNDNLPDSTVLTTNQPPDLTLLQPWPIVDIPWTGTATVVGTSVIWTSGTTFDLALVSNSIILINGVAFQTYGQPRSSTFLELTQDAGNLTGATFLIASPVLAGQALPVAFGPLEGPFLPVVGALGDNLNAGTWYFTNSANLDAASDLNTLELTSPSEPLVTGETWNGQFYVGSRENVFAIRYTFQAQATPYQFVRLPSPSGFWSRWAICRGPDGVYALGRDGLYRWTDAGGVNITDERLYPMFPHDGEPAKVVNGIYPVDMNEVDFMRMSATTFDVRFIYRDTQGDQHTLRYEVATKRFFLHTYADEMSYEYLNEPLADSPNTQQILQLSATLGNIYLAGGNNDDGTDITSRVQLPSLDGGDERAQKLYVDVMIDADNTGDLIVTPKFNNQATTGTPETFTLAGSRTQFQLNVTNVPGGMTLYRNIGILLTWTGGPDGPRVYAVEPSGYAQPYLSKRVTTQYIGLQSADWKHHRRMYPGLISNSAVTFTIQTQDGRTYTAVIASTGGQLKIVPQMLPQNIKDLLFAYELNSDTAFALFPDDFTVEVKPWTGASYIRLAVFKA